jgi:outer membrane protein TolC
MFRKTFLCLLVVRGLVLAQADAPALRLTLRRAIEMALSNRSHPDLRIAQEAERIAAARQAQGRAAMLPAFEAAAAGQNQTRNLGAQGFQFDTPPGFTIPERVGPFNTFDARLSVTQPVFDLSAIRRQRAASARATAAGADSERRRDEVAALVAHAYVRVLRAEGELAASESAIARARATLGAVRNRRDAGAGIAIDVARAEYQLAREEQQRAALQGDREHARLGLLDAMGLSFDARLEFDDQLRWVEPAVADPVDSALRARHDLAAQRKREESVRIDSQALRLEGIPTVSAYADAGVLGGGETHTIGLMVRIPVFDGGRRKAREAEADAVLRQESARAARLERSVELQVRQARVSLKTAAEQVALSDSYSALAEAEWEHARRRHDEGLTGIVELLEAQARVAAAARNRIEALFRYTEARIEAVYAAGGIRGISI